MKTLPTVLGAAVMAIAVVAWSNPVNDVVIRIDKLFSPDNVDISVGDTVSWKNFDSDNHTVTAQFFPAGAQENTFESGIIPSGGSYEHLFAKEGICRYWCTLHRETGSITVRR